MSEINSLMFLMIYENVEKRQDRLFLEEEFSIWKDIWVTPIIHGVC